MKRRLPKLFAIASLALSATLFFDGNALCQENLSTNSKTIKIISNEDRFDVSLDGHPFTTLDHATYGKPILFPIYGPGQIGMTRNWPMVEGVKGEAHDHPHHKSLWISHEFNGVDFWTEKGGRVVTSNVETQFEDNVKNAIRVSSDWLAKDQDDPVLSSEMTFWFAGDSNRRTIDCLVTFKATANELHFEDTKEGTFAVRTHPDLRLTPSPKEGVKEVFGSAINSEGMEGKAIWGKPAKWLLYKGKIDGKPVSLMMFDHPSNFRHPTMWHARDYGLIAANPFGMHHFLGKPKGANDLVLKKGESLSLRYGLEFIAGEITPEQAEARFVIFAKKQLPELKSK